MSTVSRKVRQLNKADAERFLEARTQGFGNRSKAACDAVILSERECKPTLVLGEGTGLVVTPQEREQLEREGYPKEFLDGIVGVDGMAALERRARWLGEQLFVRSNRDDRFSAMRELSELSDISDLPKEAFLKILGDEDYIVSAKAIAALAHIGPRVVPDLILILQQSPNARVREATVEVLGEIGDKTAMVIPIVLSLLDPAREPELWVRIKAARALRQMVPYCLMDNSEFDLKPVMTALDKMARNDPVSSCQREAQNTLAYL
ncbi:MAG: HEAT repeat domain-containing protein [Deltaproteobacteria bacterium]|nr:HEAT repeat domain-containing protein [Deltaproteobacteria bacterium]